VNNIDTNINSIINDLGLGASAADEKKEDFGQEQFLSLMLAQLRNQSPLEPMKNGEFLTQMAQFSSASGMQELKASFNDVAATLQSNQALQASSLVGRSVLIKSNQGHLSTGENLNGVLDLPTNIGNATINIHGQNGELIRKLELGELSAGEANFSWDGIGDDGERKPEGNYFITAEVQAEGETYSLQTYVKTSIESVTIGQGGQGLVLNLLDLGSVQLDQVSKIL